MTCISYYGYTLDSVALLFELCKTTREFLAEKGENPKIIRKMTKSKVVLDIFISEIFEPR